MYWEESGKISKLNNFLHESLYLQPAIILIIFFLQPKNLYAVWGVSPEQQATGNYRMEVGVVDHFQSIYY
jgi:hypothetical protein